MNLVRRVLGALRRSAPRIRRRLQARLFIAHDTSPARAEPLPSAPSRSNDAVTAEFRHLLHDVDAFIARSEEDDGDAFMADFEAFLHEYETEEPEQASIEIDALATRYAQILDARSEQQIAPPRRNDTWRDNAWPDSILDGDRLFSPERRGIDLLRENLTADQRRQFTAHRHFDVIGGQSGKRYRIWHCHMQNIEELDASGARTCVWCFHPGEPLVLGDIMLAQKTALELFESDALRIAHRYSDFSSNHGPQSTRAYEMHRNICAYA
jgi:hypothetical protein